jgi:hypothetical protein
VKVRTTFEDTARLKVRATFEDTAQREIRTTEDDTADLNTSPKGFGVPSYFQRREKSARHDAERL